MTQLCHPFAIMSTKTKHTDSANVLSECGGGRCAESEPEGRWQRAPSATSHEDRTFALRKDFVILQLYWWLFSSTEHCSCNMV